MLFRIAISQGKKLLLPRGISFCSETYKIKTEIATDFSPPPPPIFNGQVFFGKHQYFLYLPDFVVFVLLIYTGIQKTAQSLQDSTFYGIHPCLHLLLFCKVSRCCQTRHFLSHQSPCLPISNTGWNYFLLQSFNFRSGF